MEKKQKIIREQFRKKKKKGQYAQQDQMKGNKRYNVKIKIHTGERTKPNQHGESNIGNMWNKIKKSLLQ